MRLFLRYDWPGNVRELENVIERACIIREGEQIDRADLPPGVADPAADGGGPPALLGSHVPLEEVERYHILKVLESVGGHKKRAAEILDINPSTLYRKLLRYSDEGGGDTADEMLSDDLDTTMVDEAYDVVELVGVGEDPEVR